MGLRDSDVLDGDGGGGGATEVAPACSICLEAVMTGRGRSTAKLQCGHEFHVDCIGSAFNAKGMMQCPNCRNVEKGNWLYGNGYCSLPAFNMDEWTHDEDLYDLNYLEMPYGVHWCPVNRIGRVTSSFENGESFPSVAFQDLVGQHVIFTEFPSISVFAHPCPNLSGFHQVQPLPAPTLHASSVAITDNSLYYHQWSQVVNSTEVPSPLSLHTNDAHYHGWDHYQSLYSHTRDIAAASIQASVSHAAPRSTRLEDSGPPRAGSLFYSFIGRHGLSHTLPVRHSSSNRARAHTEGLHGQANISGEHSTSYTDIWRSGNSTDIPFAGRSSWSPSNHSGFYMYPPPVSFNSSSIRDIMSTGGQFRRSGVQFMPFTSQLLSPASSTGSMESGSWTGFWRRHASERQIARARTESSPPYGSNRLRPFI